jgi:hypothetical protein
MVFERGLCKRAAHHDTTIGNPFLRTLSTTERRQISVEDGERDQREIRAGRLKRCPDLRTGAIRIGTAHGGSPAAIVTASSAMGADRTATRSAAPAVDGIEAG